MVWAFGGEHVNPGVMFLLHAMCLTSRLWRMHAAVARHWMPAYFLGSLFFLSRKIPTWRVIDPRATGFLTTQNIFRSAKHSPGKAWELGVNLRYGISPSSSPGWICGNLRGSTGSCFGVHVYPLAQAIAVGTARPRLLHAPSISPGRSSWQHLTISGVTCI